MTSQIKGLIRFSVGLLVGLALITSCGGDPAPEAEVGEVQFNLQTTSVEGVDFWLRGCFEITGPSYPQPEVVCTWDYLEDATAIGLSVKSGAYEVFLQDGWWLDYSAQGEPLLPVDPAKVQLLSANPQTVQVVGDLVTVVTIRFEVDQTAIEFGLGTIRIVPDVEITGTLWVFVTEATVTGNLGPTPEEAVANADAICQSEADAAGLTGTFWAWLSYEVGGIVVPDYAPAYFEFWRPTMSGHRLLRTDGRPFAESWETLLLRGPSAPVGVLADGTIAPNLYTWTGTNADGTVNVAKGTCNGWTSDGSEDNGGAGFTHISDPEGWTDHDDARCSNQFSLYCFEQPAPAP